MENYVNWKLMGEAMKNLPHEEQEVLGDMFPELAMGKMKVSPIELAVALRLLPGQFLVDNDDRDVDE